jgi:ubiquinone/menaquinone biosynthesis C-methylase UbiE
VHISESPDTFFGRHHAHYAASRPHRSGRDLDRLVSLLMVLPGDRALDVATGAGFMALALARKGARVSALDATPAMLDEARLLSAQEGLEVSWHLGDAHALPFPDSTFQVVTCRRAAHHFRDPYLFLQEAHRVLVTGGRLGIVDMTAPEDAIDRLNRAEQARDPSHVAALTRAEWEGLLQTAGYDLQDVEETAETMSTTEWLEPVLPTEPAAARALEILNAPGAPPALLTAEGMLRKHWLLLTAVAR